MGSRTVTWAVLGRIATGSVPAVGGALRWADRCDLLGRRPIEVGVALGDLDGVIFVGEDEEAFFCDCCDDELADVTR
jgi:hypothetical protein